LKLSLEDILLCIQTDFKDIKRDLNDLKVSQTEIKGEIKTLDERLTGQIHALDEKFSGEIKTLGEKLIVGTRNHKGEGPESSVNWDQIKWNYPVNRDRIKWK
jgi:hypothetical protein